jgi:hypothetical protein
MNCDSNFPPAVNKSEKYTKNVSDIGQQEVEDGAGQKRLSQTMFQLIV